MTRAISAVVTLLVAVGISSVLTIRDARRDAELQAARAAGEAARAAAAEERARLAEDSALRAARLAGVDAERAGACEQHSAQQLTVVERTQAELQQAAEELQMCSAQFLVALEELEDQRRRRRAAENAGTP